MQFLEDTVSQVLEDLGIRHLSVTSNRGALLVEMGGGHSTKSALETIQKDFRYRDLVKHHPFGFFLIFESRNFPQQRSLVDFSMDFRSKQGAIISITGVMKRARLFSHTGEDEVFYSSEAFEEALEVELGDEVYTQEAESLE